MNKKLIDWWSGAIGSSYNAGYQAILDKGTALGYSLPSSGQRTKQNTLYGELVSAGFLSVMDVVRVYAGENQNFSLINWVDPDAFLATLTGSPTFTSNVGFTAGGGTPTTYINENYDPSVDGVNWVQTSASFGYYKVGPQSISTANGHIQNAADTARLQPRRSINVAYVKINGAQFLGTAQSDDGDGIWSADQFDAAGDGQKIKLLKNGVTAIQTAAASTGVSAGSLRSAYYGNDKISFFFAGASTRSIIANISTPLSTYLSSPS